MPETKELLKQLQSADLELHELTNKRDAIPKKIASLECEIESLSRNLEETKQSLTNSRKDIKLAELNLASQEESLNRYNAQLYSAKTNEEYKAFLKEIETAQRNKSAIEDTIIGLMERIEQEEAGLVNLEATTKTGIQEKQAETAQIRASQIDLETKIEARREKRDRLRNELPQEILAIYDHIRQNKGILAVAEIIEDERCSGCLNPVPAQEVIEAGHSEKLTFCEYCGRILLA